jgi:hypothetical protein
MLDYMGLECWCWARGRIAWWCVNDRNGVSRWRSIGLSNWNGVIRWRGSSLSGCIRTTRWHGRRLSGGMSGWMSGWMSGRMSGWMSGWMKVTWWQRSVSTHSVEVVNWSITGKLWYRGANNEPLYLEDLTCKKPKWSGCFDCL